MTNPKLSPAAQAVLDAAVDAYGINYSEFYCCADRVAAAALLAAANQMGCYQSKSFLYSIADAMKLIAIADELENHNV